MPDGVDGVPGQFQQMGTHSFKPMVACKPRIGVELLKQRKPFTRSMYHGSGNRVVQRHDWIV
jgi:hypothetical protein